MSDEDPNRGIIISTMIFVTGIVTYFQATWGVRLPIVQGGTISFLVPTLAILALPQWKCPTVSEMEKFDAESREELWQIRMRELSGAIAVSAMVQVILGYTGLVGKILRFVTPLTIVPTVSLVGLTLFEHAASTASKHWGIAVGYVHFLFLKPLFVVLNTTLSIFQNHQYVDIIFTNNVKCCRTHADLPKRSRH